MNKAEATAQVANLLEQVEEARKSGNRDLYAALRNQRGKLMREFGLGQKGNGHWSKAGKRQHAARLAR